MPRANSFPAAEINNSHFSLGEDHTHMLSGFLPELPPQTASISDERGHT